MNFDRFFLNFSKFGLKRHGWAVPWHAVPMADTKPTLCATMTHRNLLLFNLEYCIKGILYYNSE